jgi:predicted N-acetyltransferase YhbS
VADSWQGNGVATALLDRLAERARAEGVRRFSAEILAENRPMLELIEEVGPVKTKQRDPGSVEVEVELPPEGIGAELRETLRAAARGLLRMPHLLGGSVGAGERQQ